MKNLIPESQIPRTEHANEVWTQAQDDKLLDDYLAGGSPEVLGIKFKRKPKAIVRRIDYYRDNERDWVLNYKPGNRISRKGKRLTANEKLIIAGHRKKKIAPRLTARVLARDVSEVSSEVQDEKEEVKRKVRNATTQLAPSLDLIWALRYIYFVYKKPILSDEAYDALVSEEIEYGGGLADFTRIKDHQGWPPYIRALAGYLSERPGGPYDKTAGTTYTVGEKSGLYAGPVASLSVARSFSGKSAASRIYETKGSFTRAVARWNPEEDCWEMRDP